MTLAVESKKVISAQKCRMWAAVLWMGAQAVLCAQSVRLYSVYQRPGPDGEVVAADRQEKSREILSPAAARNAFASFHVVVLAPPGTRYRLHFGQNPDNAVTATFYREIYDGSSVPDRLEKVELPLESTMAEGHHAQAYWMDLWVDATAPVRRIRVEPQLWVDGRWIIYPLEVRIMPVVVPPVAPDPEVLEAAAAPADRFGLGPLREYLCGSPSASGGQFEPTVRQLIRRNARQDAALARATEKSEGRAEVVARLAAAARLNPIADWCADKTAPRPPGAIGPEWLLAIHDLLLRGW